MLIFDTLEIEKTKDKLAIKEAYLNKLSKTNPEEKPQEFMKLRSAYEEALAYADSDNIEVDNNPIDIWISKVNNIYDDFESRNNQDLWRSLLKDDVCQSIDTKNQVREALLIFLMENNNISKEIFILLNDYFYFIDDLDELYEEFPKLFIDNIIIDGIKNKEYPPYDLFEMKKELNYDEFLEKYYELERCFSDDNLEKIKKLLDEIDKLNINHPYLEIKRAITYYKHENINQAWDTINNIDDKYQELIEVKVARGNILVSKKEYEMAKKYFKDVIKIECNNYAAIKGLCEIYIEEGKLIEAKELIYDLNSFGYQNIYIDELSNNINDMLINELGYKIKNNNNDECSKIELSFAYIEIEDIKNAVNVFENININENIELEYYGLAGRIYFYTKQYEKSMDYLKKWQFSLEKFGNKQGNKLKKKIKSKNIPLLYQSYVYWELGDKEESFKKIEEALFISPKDISVLETKSQMLYKMRNYEGTICVCDEIIEIKQDYSNSYLLKLEALYELEFYSEAYDICEKCLEIDMYNLLAYIYKIRILIEFEEIDEAQNLIEFLEQEDICNLDLEYLKARILEVKGNLEEAKKIYKKAIVEIENKDGNIYFKSDLYYQYALIDEENIDYNKMLELLNKSLEYDENHVDSLYSKAYVLQYTQEYEESLNLYKKLRELKPNHILVNKRIMEIYEEREDYIKSLKYCNKQIELTNDIDDYLERSNINLMLGNLDEMWKDLEYLNEKYPNDERVHLGIGLYYDALDISDKSLEFYLKSATLMEKSENYLFTTYTKIALAYRRLKEYKKAINYYEKNYEVTGEIENLYEIYDVYLLCGEFKLAKKALRRYIKAKKLWRLNSEYQHNMGKILWKKGKLSEAYEYLSTAAIDTYEGRVDAGILLYYRGKYKKALKYINKAIKDYADDYRCYIYAGRICMALNDTQKAREYAKAGIERLPQNLEADITIKPMMYQNAASLYTILGDYGKSKEFIEKAFNMPRCMHCSYSKCIDAIIAQIYMDKSIGDLDEAMKNCIKGLEISPFDEDINYLYKNLKK